MNPDRLKAFWQQRAPRERLLAMAAAMAALLFAVDTLAFRPVRTQIAAEKRRLSMARADLDSLQRLLEQRDRIGNRQLQARRADLDERLSSAQGRIEAAQLVLVDPEQMARQLSAILKRYPKLRVIGMTTGAAVPVDQNGEKTRGAPPNAEARRAMLYQHGLELTVEGGYLDLIAYLQELQGAPYRIYWQQLELKADSKDAPITRIRCFTLSRGPTWLSL